MNPFFEQQWRDAHATLITYLGDTLQERLPADLVARTEEEVVSIGIGEQATTYRPDLQIREPWTLREPSAAAVSTESAIPASDPIRVFVEDEVERWIEIRDTTGRLITVIELLSPTNKLEAADRDRYLRKRLAFLRGGANLVEIDVVRQGAWVFPQAIRSILQQKGACYAVCVIRVGRGGEHELYPIPLRERLPSIRVPLRTTDADVILELQPLIDQCHERRRYHMLNYRVELNPPLAPDDAAWATQLLRERSLV